MRYRVKTTLLANHERDERIGEQVYNNYITAGCPESWFEEVQGFEVGDWAVIVNSGITQFRHGTLVRLVEDGHIPSWKTENVGQTDHWFYDNKDLRKATKDEIKQALVEEAKRRGFDKDTKFTGLYGSRWSCTYGCGYEYNIEEDRLKKNCGTVYEQGEWAEIVEDDDPDIEINGYKAEFHDDYVKFGCAKIDKKFFTEMYKSDTDAWNYFGSGNRSVTGIRFGEGVFELDDIQKIAEYYGQKD